MARQGSAVVFLRKLDKIRKYIDYIHSLIYVCAAAEVACHKSAALLKCINQARLLPPLLCLLFKLEASTDLAA